MRLIDADFMVELIKAQITTNEDDKSTAGMAAKRVMGRLIEFVNDLPTAQPEIIRCKDCVKREICRTTNIWAVAPGDDFFCADAERRTYG